MEILLETLEKLHAAEQGIDVERPAGVPQCQMGVVGFMVGSVRVLRRQHTNPERMADLAKKQLRKKIPARNWRWRDVCCRTIVSC